jgi:drug/metabolite transporter (DMT)-like permease
MQTIAIAIIVLGSLMWVAGALFLKYRPSPISVYVSTAIQLFSAGIFCLLISILTGEANAMSNGAIGTDSLFALFYLAIVSSLITFLAFIWLIKVQPAAIVSTYSYVNPLVATLLGWAFANERITSVQLVALGIILMGVLFVNIPKYANATETGQVVKKGYE